MPEKHEHASLGVVSPWMYSYGSTQVPGLAWIGLVRRRASGIALLRKEGLWQRGHNFLLNRKLKEYRM